MGIEQRLAILKADLAGLSLGPAAEAAALAAGIDIDWTRRTLRDAARILRIRRMLTQARLAARCGLSQAAISDIERGHSDPPWSTIERIFRALDCEPLVLPRPLNDWPHQPPSWRPNPERG